MGSGAIGSGTVVKPDGSAVGEAALRAFVEGFRGRVITASEPDYHAARRVWNGMVDKKPALIARCAGVADVMRAVDFARDEGLTIAVRGGGHNVAGNAVCDGGIVIDLAPMKGTWVDPGARTARAQGGVVLGELDRETAVFGLATVLGTVTATGIGGLTLGGGVGWLMRRFGLACDNLVSADVVTADARLVRASPRENPDLLWGLRGGGGNFGVVTSFEYRLHEVAAVYAGPVIFPIEQARDVLRAYRDYTAGAPDEMTAFCGILTAPDGTPVVAVILCYSGRLEDGERCAGPVRTFGTPIEDGLGPVAYTALQSMFDADPSSQNGHLNYLKSDFLTGLPDEAIDAIVEHARAIPSPWSFLFLEHMSGAVSRVAAHESAFSHRDAAYNFVAWSCWEDAADSHRQIAWARDVWSALQPVSTGGVYLNYMGEEGEERVRAAYGGNYERLAALKAKYDPSNLFRLNQNVRPA